MYKDIITNFDIINSTLRDKISYLRNVLVKFLKVKQVHIKVIFVDTS